MRRLSDSAAVAAFRGLRCLPVGVVSSVGAVLGHLYALNASLRRHLWFKRTVENMAALAGVDRKEAHRRVFQLLRNSGRVTAEFTVIDKCAHTGAIRILGLEHLAAVAKPVVIVSAHVANWEIAGAALVLSGKPITALYDPPASETIHRLARAARWRMLAPAPGCRLIAASHRAARDLLKAATQRENLLIYIDEQKDGNVWCPSLGRPLPMRGNRVLAARLAIKHDMEILPIYVRRIGGARFEVVVEPVLAIDRDADAASEAHRIADEIAATAERWVRADLAHWYWLPNLRRDRPLPQVEYRTRGLPAADRNDHAG